jgi:regulator of nucleoside diphosphate kinase
MISADEKPPITISAPDYDRLERIVHAGRHTRRPPPSAPVLSAELERAHVVPADEVGSTVVAMHSTLTFRDDASGEIRRVTLVYPGEQDIAVGRISVLTPIGAALIGLSEGQSIHWRTANDELRRLTVLEVHGRTSEPAR